MTPGTGTSAPRVVTFLMASLHCSDGIASYIELLAEQLKGRGWGVTIGVGEAHAAGGAVERLNRLQKLADRWTVETALLRPRRNSPWAIAAQARALGLLAREHHSSIFHLNGRALGPACRLQHLLGGPPHVNTMQLGLSEGQRPGRLSRNLLGPTLGQRYIAISRETAIQAREWLGVPADRIRLVHHGFHERFRPPTSEEREAARARFGLTAGQFVCVTIARLEPIKRHDVVIEAIRLLRDEGRDVVALFAGEGDAAHRQRLTDLAAERGVAGRVRFVGHVDPLPVLWAGDVKVLPSDREGFAIVVPEAMASGLVVMRTPTEGATDQIEHDRTGLLFARGDAAALAACLRRMADKPAERSAIGAAGLAAARSRFSAQTMAAKTSAIYCELLDQEPARPDTLVQTDRSELT